MAEIKNWNPGREGGLAKLENWRVYPYFGCQVAEGDVFNDKRWDDGTHIYTSAVQSISEDKTQLQTRNTTYALGQPAVEPKSKQV